MNRQMDGESPADKIRAQDGNLCGWSRTVRIAAVDFDNGNQGKLPGTGHFADQALYSLDMP